MFSMNDYNEKILMFTQKDCPHCISAKAELKKQLKSGEIIEAPVEKDEWMNLASKLGIRGTPTLIKVKQNGSGKVKPDNIEVSGKCDLEEYKQTGECKGGYPFDS